MINSRRRSDVSQARLAHTDVTYVNRTHLSRDLLLEHLTLYAPIFKLNVVYIEYILYRTVLYRQDL